MFAKLLVAIIVMVGLGVGLLCLRQQRLTALHAMAELHATMDHTRKQTWNLQTRIAKQSDPVKLRQKLAAAGIKMVPITTDNRSSRHAAVPLPRLARRETGDGQ